MSEIVTPLLELPEGQSFSNDTGAPVYIITDDHSLNDILRYLLTQTDAEELVDLIRLLADGQKAEEC